MVWKYIPTQTFCSKLRYTPANDVELKVNVWFKKATIRVYEKKYERRLKTLGGRFFVHLY